MLALSVGSLNIDLMLLENIMENRKHFQHIAEDGKLIIVFGVLSRRDKLTTLVNVVV